MSQGPRAGRRVTVRKIIGSRATRYKGLAEAKIRKSCGTNVDTML
jgi:hypothetical protein